MGKCLRNIGIPMMDHDLHQKNIGYHWIFFHPLRLNHKPTKNPSSQINGSWNAVDDTKNDASISWNPIMITVFSLKHPINDGWISKIPFNWLWIPFNSYKNHIKPLLYGCWIPSKIPGWIAAVSGPGGFSCGRRRFGSGSIGFCRVLAPGKRWTLSAKISRTDATENEDPSIIYVYKLLYCIYIY